VDYLAARDPEALKALIGIRSSGGRCGAGEE
jgi:hypothetical protein